MNILSKTILAIASAALFTACISESESKDLSATKQVANQVNEGFGEETPIPAHLVDISEDEGDFVPNLSPGYVPPDFTPEELANMEQSLINFPDQYSPIYDDWTGNQAPLTVEAKKFTHTYTGQPDYYVILRSKADTIEIRSMSLNRGNCEHSDPQKVKVPHSFPISLQFGQSLSSRAFCSKVIEATVDTNYGEYVFTFD